MKKNNASFRNSGVYTSPGTPEYGDGYTGGLQRGWSSERVPLPANNSRRHVSATALMPFNSGRTLPSKWDDAERWITSPISAYGVCKASVVQPQRRPKSKSGPLGSPGVMQFSNYAPAFPVHDTQAVTNYLVGSPFTTGVLVADGLSIYYGGSIGAQSDPVQIENSMAPQRGLPGWSDFLSESSIPSSQDEKTDCNKDAETMVSPVISRRDMATQMSPEGSNHSSPKGSSSLSTSPFSIPRGMKSNGNCSAKDEIRDVQVDKGAIEIKDLGKNGSKMRKKSLLDVKNLTSDDITEERKKASVFQREEAKITAWENLQKAKAEAAIKKLEIHLEKKRLASMDRILNKLRTAQTKAQEMRSSITETQASRAPRKLNKVVKMSSLGFLVPAIFLCHLSIGLIMFPAFFKRMI